jgi:hypothetical protein
MSAMGEREREREREREGEKFVTKLFICEERRQTEDGAFQRKRSRGKKEKRARKLESRKLRKTDPANFRMRTHIRLEKTLETLASQNTIIIHLRY